MADAPRGSERFHSGDTPPERYPAAPLKPKKSPADDYFVREKDLLPKARAEVEETVRQKSERLGKLEDPAKIVASNERILTSINKNFGLKFNLDTVKDAVGFLPAITQETNNQNLVEDIRRLQRKLGVDNDGKFGPESLLAFLNYSGKDTQLLGRVARLMTKIHADGVNITRLKTQLNAHVAKQKIAPTPQPAPEPAPKTAPTQPPAPALTARAEGLSTPLDTAHQTKLNQLKIKLNDILRDTLARFSAQPQTIESGARNEALFREGVLAAFREAGLKPPPENNITLGWRQEDEIKASLDGFLAQAEKDLLHGQRFAELKANTERMEAQQQAKIKEATDRRQAGQYKNVYETFLALIQQYKKYDAAGKSTERDRAFDNLSRLMQINYEVLPTWGAEGFTEKITKPEDFAHEITAVCLGARKDINVASARQAYTTYFASR